MHAPGAKNANRVNVILNDDTFARTRSLTPGMPRCLQYMHVTCEEAQSCCSAPGPAAPFDCACSGTPGRIACRIADTVQ
jgi:hypothetical protein